MTTRKGIPPALEQYICFQEKRSTILLTSTIHCTTTWLTARFVGATLAQQTANVPLDEGETNETETAVVLASWMRDERFWKNEVRRATGVDTTKAESQNRFAFIDCLSLRPPESNKDQPNSSHGKADKQPNPDENLSYISTPIAEAITRLATTPTGACRRIMLIFDQPDLLLATGETEYPDLGVLVRRRPEVHTTVLAVSTDLPLVSASPANGSNPHPTPLERNCANFVVMRLHSVLFTMACRELATGAARDVSGVVRITRGGGVYNYDGDPAVPIKSAEMLYLVGKDGGVKVFERGAAEGG